MHVRQIIAVTGADRESFLQNLVTNDVARLKEGLVWTALLTPQGKYLADFFLVPEGETILIDVAEPLAQGLFQRLSMYKLRADVTLTPRETGVACGTGDTPAGAFTDPRHPALGWRAYDGRAGADSVSDALRVQYLVPESGIELVPNDSYPLEMNFEALNGVDFRKGCYVGQEVTARMKHKTELKKGLTRVSVSGAVDVGTEIQTDTGKPAGTIYTQAEGAALAYLRFDRAAGQMEADHASVIWNPPEPPKHLKKG